jgi:hypothetical protein
LQHAALAKQEELTLNQQMDTTPDLTHPPHSVDTNKP